jgi:thiosulfate/3-mercaptopyruvate sulfurtransferase
MHMTIVAALAMTLTLPISQVTDATSRTAHTALVVTTAWLAAHLNDPDLVLLHVGEKSAYDQAHLPGARFVSTGDLAVSDPTGVGLHLEMLPADVLRQRLESLGISDKSRVVVYYGKDWISPTTRILFTLDYAGLGDRTVLLNGGQGAWVRDGHAVTSEVPPPRPGSLAPLKLRPLVVDADYVKAHLHVAGTALVDARDPMFYKGASTGGGPDHPHRRGHIAGAVSIPFSTLTDDTLMVRSQADLEAAFTRAGVKPGDTVVAYCHIGQQATAALFAARALAHPVLLYDGSFEDWSRRDGYPVDDPSATEKK